MMQAMLIDHMSPRAMLGADMSRVARHWLLRYADNAAVQMSRHAGWLPVCDVTCWYQEACFVTTNRHV